MIISTGNVNMSSSRSYSKNIQTSTAVLSSTADGSRRQYDTFSSAMNRNESSAYVMDYYYDRSAGSKDSYCMYDAESAKFRLTASAEGTATGSIEDLAGNTPATSLSEAFKKEDPFVIRRTFLSLLEMLSKARFKDSLQNSDYNGQTISLTSSTQTQVWNRLEVSSYFMEEKENTAFTSEGTVVTADGRNISFGITMEMSRSFTESSEFCNFSQYEQILTDPLIINLDTDAAGISDMKFLFDLDADGTKEEISTLSESSGYLALDKNGDGIINDGSELFGPATGNGFSELASFDSDHNGWIDEADEIYEKLKVWTKDSSGRDVLLSLKNANVGAISLGSAKTEFSLTDEDDDLHGQVRSTGIYLKENGEAGTIQQVDF